MIKLNELNLAMTDVETTGLDSNEHEIIEIATIIYNPREDKIIKEWETKVAPRHIETADQEALRINGYLNNHKLYITNLKSALIKFNSLVGNCIIVGQNTDFDLAFINKAMDEFNILPSFDYRKLDLMSLVWWAVKDTDIPGLSLTKICNHFNISNVGEHSALVDCRRTFEVYKELSKIYK